MNTNALKIPTTHNNMFEVDVANMRKIHGARDKIFIIREMVQNGWDEDISRVDILLTPPDENGHSIIKVTDDNPGGWLSLEHAYTMYAESAKANDPTKRGRFNEGEKNVLCLAIEASVTTVSGQVCFDRVRGRWAGTQHRKRGSEFFMKFELTQKEYFDICMKTMLLIPPKDIVTTFNGQELPHRAPDLQFETRLRTPVNGRNDLRKTDVRLYHAYGKQAWLYEMGIPVVPLGDDPWHINVMQKMPVGRDRDNIPPSYLADVRVAIFNKFYDKLPASQQSLLSMQAAAGNPKSSREAVEAHMKGRFGNDFVMEDPNDEGSKEECQSQGIVVIERNDLSPEMRKRLRKMKDKKNPKKSYLRKAGEVCPTNVVAPLDNIVPPEEYDIDTANYVALIERLAPLVINRPVKAVVIDDDDSELRGCFKYETGVMHVNLAYHDTGNWATNYWLMIHEFAHNTVNSNAHLKDVFYKTEEEIAGKLMVLALNEPELFDSKTITEPRIMFTGKELVEKMSAVA
jgi:hypothetical protein